MKRHSTPSSLICGVNEPKLRFADRRRAKRYVFTAPDGKRCAAGCLIPDDRYQPSFKYTVVGGTEGTHNNRANAVTLLMEEIGHDINLVKALQSVHDDAEVAQWEGRLEQIAEDFGLLQSATVLNRRPIPLQNHHS